MNLYWGIFIATMLASWLVSALFNRRMRQYSAIRTSMTGREVAERMLRENGITDVKVVCTGGVLTDHYNPANQTVNLSREVYEGATLAAMAVAAHECGHAVQHAVGYAPLRMRSALVPVVNFSSRWVCSALCCSLLLRSARSSHCLWRSMPLCVLSTGWKSLCSLRVKMFPRLQPPCVLRLIHTSLLHSHRSQRCCITLQSMPAVAADNCSLTYRTENSFSRPNNSLAVRKDCYPEKEPAKVVFRRAEARVAFMPPSGIRCDRVAERS